MCRQQLSPACACSTLCSWKTGPQSRPCKPHPDIASAAGEDEMDLDAIEDEDLKAALRMSLLEQQPGEATPAPFTSAAATPAAPAKPSAPEPAPGSSTQLPPVCPPAIAACLQPDLCQRCCHACSSCSAFCTKACPRLQPLASAGVCLFTTAMQESQQSFVAWSSPASARQ